MLGPSAPHQSHLEARGKEKQLSMDAEISGEDDAIDELEGARLLARGVEIKLRDGPHRLILDYEALEFIEEEFDGIDGFMAALNETRLKQKRLRSIRLG